jgi:hypothetical protein
MRKGLNIMAYVAGSLIFLSLPILFSPDFFDFSELVKIAPFQRDLLSYLLALAFFFLCHFLLVPKLYFQRRYVAFGLLALLGLAVMLLLPNTLIPDEPEHFRPPFRSQFGSIWPQAPQPDNINVFHYGKDILLFAIVLLFSIFLRVQNRLKHAEAEKANAELRYLRAQINPHFLFNTLNSIYALAIEKSDDAPEAIVKLSAMMRYVTSEALQPLVPLAKEIEYIGAYIDLQKLRFGEAVTVHFLVNGDPTGRSMSPLLLIPFVENAFKHGINTEEVSEISIQLDITGTVLRFTVDNLKVAHRNTEADGSGLGIENTRHRLQLSYPGKHELKIVDDALHFQVCLNIQLQ